ncbi:unnamed protein product [Amoebophrya sp. A120]|nr:unnamed protein product [Amoebophrya sp. A120]|eukprot:GSA120T00010100001.1
MACVLPLFLIGEEDGVLPKMQIPKEDSRALGAILVVLAQAIVNLWIFSVWTWRFNKQTPFRARNSQSLLQEFQSYGYDLEVMKWTGFVKLFCATLLPIAIMNPEYPWLLIFSSGVLFLLMVIAIVSHVRVKDPWVKNVPALVMAVLSLASLLGLKENCVYMPDYAEDFSSSSAVSSTTSSAGTATTTFNLASTSSGTTILTSSAPTLMKHMQLTQGRGGPSAGAATTSQALAASLPAPGGVLFTTSDVVVPPAPGDNVAVVQQHVFQHNEDFLNRLVSQDGRLVIGLTLLLLDFAMLFYAKFVGRKYAQVPNSPDNPFFALVESNSRV